MGLGGRLEEAAAQHRGQGERHRPRHDDGNADDRGELVEEPAHHAPHEQHRNEHGGQGEGHGHDGEADLARAQEGRLQAPHPVLHVPHDVLQHHDGVVHHEAHGEGEGHEREVVDGVAEHLHRRECPHDREGQREARDDGGRDVPQEEEDDQDHERDGEKQGELDVLDRRADGNGPVVEDVEVDGGGQLGREAGQDLLDRIHDLDGVGAGLALDGQDDRALVLVP